MVGGRTGFLLDVSGRRSFRDLVGHDGGGGSDRQTQREREGWR